MIRTISFFTGLLLFLRVTPGVRAEAAAEAPDFKEVYDLVRAHLAGAGEAELNRAAVQGFVAALGPKVSLIAAPSSETATNEPSLLKSRVFEAKVAYVRIRRVEAGLDKSVRAACETLGATNKLQGVVLDLRYAGGNDYAAAAAVADLFLKQERPLLDWGEGLVRSKEKPDALGLPVAVLVNHQTAGAAEALAATLRETGTALILGNPTAGQAMVTEEYPLKDGERLRIATAPVRLGDGSSLTSDGVKPDIAVEVSSQDERAYYANAFQLASRPGSGTGNSLSNTNQVNGTNRPVRRIQFNEAELVRERKEGIGAELDMSAASPNASVEQAVVQDPALARALDVLKGLALVRHSRS